VFRELKVVSAQLWRQTPKGQHVELGIAENNLFLLLAALGLSHRCSASACCRSARSTIPSSRAASMR
jgi:pyruvate dehydrogenase complex dehydrogenase (E1) component